MAISRYLGIPLLTAMSLAISLGLLSMTPAEATSAQSPAVAAEQSVRGPA